MTIDKRWLVLLAVATTAAVGAALAQKSRRHRQSMAHEADIKAELRTWENEGGNLAPGHAASVAP